MAQTHSRQILIGLEVHAKLLLQEKLFSKGLTNWNASKNTLASGFDLAVPGTYPALNTESIALAIRAASSLSCRIASVLSFDRKHYSYFDLPHGYQITQHRHPIGRSGFLRTARADVRVEEVHLEMDSAKQGGLDYNRAGVGLLEVVTAPCFEDIESAISFVDLLRRLFRAIRVCDGRMERGSLRIDVNVSNVDGSGRCEVKNINSYDTMRRIALQPLLYEELRRATRCTMSVEDGKLLVTRTKQAASEYNFIPEFDLPDTPIPDDLVRAVKKQMPKTPDQLDEETAALGSSKEAVSRLSDLELQLLYLQCVNSGADASKTLKFLTNEFLCALNNSKADIIELDCVYPELVGFILAVQEGRIPEHLTNSILAAIIGGKPWQELLRSTKHCTLLSPQHEELLVRLASHARFERCAKTNNFDALIGLAFKMFAENMLPRPDARNIASFFRLYGSEKRPLS